MKTIKIIFRGWDNEIKYMYYPPNSHIVLWCGGYCVNLQTGKKLIPMFWTGLLDRNGKEIYEGDLVKHPYAKNYLLVKWEKLGFGLYRKNGELSLATLDNEYEIIGNIYENENKEPLKELLK